jgi:hypothetical protein
MIIMLCNLARWEKSFATELNESQQVSAKKNEERQIKLVQCDPVVRSLIDGNAFSVVLQST